MFYCNSQRVENCLDCVSPMKLQQHLNVHFFFGLREKSFSRVLIQYISRKHGFSRNLFGIRFSLLTTSWYFCLCCRSDAAFADYPLAFADFWDDKFSYSAIICFESGSLAWTSAVISTGVPLLNLSKFRFMVSDSAWTNRQICITKVKELHEPCFKYRNSFLALLCLWCAVCSQFLLFKNLWAVRDILLRSISSKLRVLFFIGRIEPIFPKTLRRVYDLAFSNFAQILVEKKFDFLEG